MEASPQSQQVDSAKLEGAVWRLDFGNGDLLIIRKGTVIYQRGDTTHDQETDDLAQPLLGLLLGNLLGPRTDSEEVMAADFESALEGQYGGVSLHHLVTHTSGYDAVGGDSSGDNSPSPYAPGTPLFGEGNNFLYWNEAMMMSARVLTQMAGDDLKKVFDERIAAPIGIETWDWDAAGQIGDVPIRGGNGGVRLSARDVARIGHLFLCFGEWAGEELVSPFWLARSTSVQVPSSVALYGSSTIDGTGHAGYGWWRNVSDVGVKRWPDAPGRMFASVGHDRNRLFVIPEWNVIVVHFPKSAIEENTYNDFFSALGNAMEAKATTPRVTGFTLVNAVTNHVISAYDPLVDGATVNLPTLPSTVVDIRANTDPFWVGSVELTLEGPSGIQRIENAPPYSIGGDAFFWGYGGWGPTESGIYGLTATPYRQTGAGGEPGESLSVTFEITLDESASCKSACATGTSCAQHDVDPNNCGACGVVCPEGQVCSTGECRNDCRDDNLETACGRWCANLFYDRFHCGECSYACGRDEVCYNGECRRECGSATRERDGRCVATDGCRSLGSGSALTSALVVLGLCLRRSRRTSSGLTRPDSVESTAGDCGD